MIKALAMVLADCELRQQFLQSEAPGPDVVISLRHRSHGDPTAGIGVSYVNTSSLDRNPNFAYKAGP